MKKYDEQQVRTLMFDEDSEGNESDSDPDSWKTDEGYPDDVDPYEDENLDNETDQLDPRPPTPHTTSSGPLATSSSSSSSSTTSPRRRDGGRGRGRGQGPRVLDEGSSWKDAEEEDTLHRMPNFCPKRPPGLQTLTDEDKPAVKLFKLFFGPREMTTICKHTNINAANRIAKGKKFKWVELKPAEFFHFIGLLFYMAILQLPRLVDYWRQRSIFSVSFPRNVMTRDRFTAIARSVHISHPEEDVTNDQKKGTLEYDPLHRVKPLYITVREACKALWHPRKQIAIDERMVATKAKISIRQYMKSKPTKWGVKLFVLADSSNGYTTDFIIYTGKSRFTSGQGLSHDVVMSLMDSAHLGRGYHLYCDNFYTSPKLFQDLFERGFVACGTYRDTRRGKPTAVGALSKKSARGSIKWIRAGELLFVKWMDTREVTVCSTIHKAFSGQTVARNVKCKETGRWEKKAITVPDAVVDYNRYMGGVDLSDQLIQYYSVHRRSNKWYRTLLYHFIDIAATNSYILYMEQCATANKKPMSHLGFMEELAAGLCGVTREWPTPSRGADCLPVCLNNSEADEEEPEGATAGAGRKPGAAAKGRRRCAHCGRTASWKCRHCDVVLCLVAHRNCFTEWHDRKAPVAETSAAEP